MKKGSIEQLKEKALNDNNMLIVRLAAFLQLNELLTEEEFKEIEPTYIKFRKEMIEIFED